VSLAGAPAEATTLPERISAPRPHVMTFKAFAAGVQVYACAPRPDDPDALTWTLKAPAADLWDDDGRKIGTHYAGPTWQGADGSIVTGQAVERADAPLPGAIPWLLLRASDAKGAGMFGAVTYIQRLDTVGGAAPVGGCDRSTVGAEHAVEYSATYAFYAAYLGDAE
jgi:hypothetical protein